MKNVIAHHCSVLADGTVIPDPGFEGPRTQQGPFRGSVSFSWLPERGTEPHMIVAERSRRAAAGDDALIGVVSRDILYFFLQEERINGYFNGSAWPLPTVGGAYPSCLNYADYPSGGASGPAVDPSTVLTDAPYGWKVPDPTLDPYYLTHGASIWVAGFEGVGTSPGDVRPPVPGYSGWVDLPDREVLLVDGMRTLSQTIGGDNYEWDVYAITVREYRYKIYTWAQWWAIA